MQTQTLLTYTLIAGLSVIVPGPATLLAIRNGAAGGLRSVVPSTLGNMSGLFMVSAAAMLGLGVILQSSALLFTLLKLAGAAYLIYMGLRHLTGRSKLMVPTEGAPTGTVRSARRLYAEAVFVAGLNPKPILFFTALFPQFLNTTEPLLPQFFILTGIFMTLSMISLLTIGSLAQRARGLLRRPHFLKWLNRVMGSVFVSFGVALLRLKRMTP